MLSLGFRPQYGHLFRQHSRLLGTHERVIAASCHLQHRHLSFSQPRNFSPTPDPPSIGTLAAVALGLPLVLWTYKCLMMVLFQRRLIYMEYVPLGARKEELTSYQHLFHGIVVQEVKLSDTNSKVTLHGIVVNRATSDGASRRATIMYLQGNAGNPLQRIPLFKSLLAACSDLDLRIIAVAPRSFWKSSPRRPTERALLSDYSRILYYARTTYPDDPIFLLGHSLGASISVCLTSAMNNIPQIRGLILENAFSSIPDMVRALYTSKWLPYHYLGPFVLDKWDAVKAAKCAPESSLFHRCAKNGNLLILQSQLDELVPSYMGDQICQAAGIEGPVVIRQALHENAWIASLDWGRSIHDFLNRNIPR